MAVVVVGEMHPSGNDVFVSCPDGQAAMPTSKRACSVAFSGRCASTAPEDRIFFLRLLFLLMKPAPKTCDSLHLAHSQRKQQDNTPGTRTRVDAMRLADQIAAALKAADVTYIFSLSGNQIMSLYDALLDHDIRIVHVRHEAAAVHMADAWARVTGTPGVALLTAGPGHANAISAMYTARGADVPILILSGHAPVALAGQSAFQEMDQVAMAAPACKAAMTPTTSQSLLDSIPAGLSLAARGRPGPVQISMPVDLLEGAATPETGSRPAGLPAAGGDNDVEVLRASLAAAERPLVLAGPAAMRGDTWERLQGLWQHGVPVVGCESPRGLRDPSLGAFARVLGEADQIILVGKLLDFTLGFGKPPAFASEARVLAVAPDIEMYKQVADAAGERFAGGIIAPLASAAASLGHAATNVSPENAWSKNVSDAVTHRPADWQSLAVPAERAMHPVAVFARVQAAMEQFEDWTLIADGGEVGQWAQACLRAPRRLINGVPGAIGAAIPMAVGARLARDVPTVAIVGDGTFGFHAMEMDTAVRAGAAVIVIVCNDARWNAEHQIQLNNYGQGRLHSCDLQPTRYDLVVEPFGVHPEHVGTGTEFDAAFARAIAAGRPVCINVSLDGQPAPTIKDA